MFTDIRTAIIKQYPTEINKKYLYIAKPKYSSQLMPETGFYTGYDLIYCKDEGLAFELLEEYSCDTVDNTYSPLINDYFDRTKNVKDKEFQKLFFNKIIGNFQNGCGNIRYTTMISKICNSDEALHSTGIMEKYNDEYTFCYEDSKIYEIYTRKIIAIQIINMARRIMYEKMKELKLNDSNIIQINVDEIIYVDNGVEITDIDESDYTAWKIPKKLSYKNCEFNYTGENKFINDTPSFKPHKNYLYEGYAGCGKTHKLINDIIPKLLKKIDDNDSERSLLVLSPSHSSLEDYRKAKLNCDVIQKFSLTHTIPKEDIIIIDEIGLCNKDANDVIFKCFLDGKQIISFGDFKQLLPVNEISHFNNKEYIQYIYNCFFTIKSNHRNMFTIDYYESLINEKIELMDEMKKYRTEYYEDAECIICKTNKKCDLWNKKIMKEKNISREDIGFKTICKTNKLRDKGIFNNFIFTVTDRDDDTVTLDNNYVITLKEFEKCDDKGKKIFRPAYARTAYNIQGKSLKSFYVPNSELINFNDGRSAYTIISRLKTDECLGEINDKKYIPKKKDNVLFTLELI